MTEYICKCGYRDVEPACKDCADPEMRKMTECYKCGILLEQPGDWGKSYNKCYEATECLERRVEKLERVTEVPYDPGSMSVDHCTCCDNPSCSGGIGVYRG